MPTCPACGRKLPHEADVIDVDLTANVARRGSRTIRLSPQQAVILHLLASGPKDVDDLLLGLHGSVQPPTARRAFHVIMVSLRRRVLPLGIEIATSTYSRGQFEYQINYQRL